MRRKMIEEYRSIRKARNASGQETEKRPPKGWQTSRQKNQTASTLCSRETAVSTGAGSWKQILPGSLAGQYGGNKWT